MSDFVLFTIQDIPVILYGGVAFAAVGVTCLSFLASSPTFAAVLSSLTTPVAIKATSVKPTTTTSNVKQTGGQKPHKPKS